MIQIKINKLPKSELEIEAQLEANVLEALFPKALKNISENIEMDGFRKGKVPENIILSKVGELAILEEAAEIAINENYPKILEENKIDAIGRPSITITKIARNNPLEFKIKTAVLPEVNLPDYKKISQKTISDISAEDKNIEVSDQELENTIMDIRKSRAPKINMQDIAKKDEPTEENKNTEEVKLPEVELPELNDDFVKALGPFKDVADFREKLKENIKLEKINQAREKTRLKIIEAIIEKTEAEIPEVLIDSELEKILYRMETDISAMGLKFEDYLVHIKKTKEDLRKEFRQDAEKKAKFSLVLFEISKQENIKADTEEVAKEVAHILEHYKDADPDRAQMHAENVLTNEKIFQFLENQGK
ncbi:MAG: hypothetical protein K9L98_01495 [Candidatus Pacebacteria bacterium]|nr:hypothetical protein [Candidatus Paceibacterota bacterium]MCF7862667.1 hypothetical protein [Candidatus Paceibacterota bacterium]